MVKILDYVGWNVPYLFKRFYLCLTFFYELLFTFRIGEFIPLLLEPEFI